MNPAEWPRHRTECFVSAAQTTDGRVIVNVQEVTDDLPVIAHIRMSEADWLRFITFQTVRLTATDLLTGHLDATVAL